MRNKLKRVTKSFPCPLCGHTEGCANVDGTNVWMCLRNSNGCLLDESGQPRRLKKGMGYMHIVGPGAKVLKFTGKKDDKKYLSHNEIKAILKTHRDALTKKRLQAFCESTGLSERSVTTYEIGYDPATGFYSFPMRDGHERYCGIRLRSLKGKKISVRGSKPGLFIPKNLNLSSIPKCISDDPFPLMLVTPEGPTTSSAAFDLGFQAIGRPSNIGGIDELRELLARNPRQDVVEVADNDSTKWLKDKDGNPTEPFWPGWEGALATADAIYPVCGRLRIIKPPKGCKDLRDWLKSGGTMGLLCEIIAKAEIVTPQWIAEKTEEVRVWKKNLKRPEKLAA